MPSSGFSNSSRVIEPIFLWSHRAPGALGDAPADKPDLSVFFPDPSIATGAGMVIFPGGGYGNLAGHEGEGYAQWLVAQGMVAMVVKYRLGSVGYRHPVMLQDAARAVRLARSNAAQWGLDPQRIGVMGSSAGGHLASTIVTHFDAGDASSEDPVERMSSRPDLAVLCYPVITMLEGTHGGSRTNLLGENPSPELLELLSSEMQTTENTPPCFIWHTWEDESVQVENAMAFAAALRKKGVRFELHVYEKGGHGMGLGPGPHRWSADCLSWLCERGFAVGQR